jgi:hypothetical protein
VDALGAPVHNISRVQGRKIFEPQAGFFGFAMPELPRLKLLRCGRKVSNAFAGVAVHDRVLNGHTINRGVPECGE